MLLELEAKMSEEFREYYVGREVTALMEEEWSFAGERYFVGYTKEYVKVAVKTDDDLTNQFTTGKIKECLTKDVYLMG